LNGKLVGLKTRGEGGAKMGTKEDTCTHILKIGTLGGGEKK